MANEKFYDSLCIGSIIKELEQKERAHDRILGEARPLVRKCANCIRMLHCADIAGAKAELQGLERGLAGLPKGGESWDYLLSPILQEVVEAKLFLAAVQRQPLPSYKKLKVLPQVYLLGLCDAIGEFRRQMLEELKAGKVEDAAYYFSLMNGIYEQISVVRFSNSVLPNFKRKQDVARGQVEMARSELLRARQ